MDFEKWIELANHNHFGILRRELTESNEVDIAEFMSGLDDEKMLAVYRILPKDMSAAVFSYMSSEQRQHIIMSISDKEVSIIMDELFLDDTIDFLEEIPAGVVKKVLKNVDENTRQLINAFLQYPTGSAGSIMTVEFVEISSLETVGGAIDKIRKTGIDKETVYTCYVIDKKRRLQGTIALRTLLFADNNVIVKDIMDERFVTANTLDDQEKVADIIRKYDYLSLPVVDAENRLVGIVTVDDAIDVIEEENTEDFEKMAAMTPSEKPYLKTSVWILARNRIVWLMILMISATVTGSVIGRYEELLATMLVLTTFIPMLTNTGGNAGSQSSTLVIRGMALDEIKSSDVFQVMGKEFLVSLICGSALAFVNFIRLIIIKTPIDIAFVVTISILCTVIVAKLIGSILPIGAKKLKLDPAIMASPLITTIVDAVALVIYFSLASFIFGI